MFYLLSHVFKYGQMQGFWPEIMDHARAFYCCEGGFNRVFYTSFASFPFIQYCFGKNAICRVQIVVPPRPWPLQNSISDEEDKLHHPRWYGAALTSLQGLPRKSRNWGRNEPTGDYSFAGLLCQPGKKGLCWQMALPHSQHSHGNQSETTERAVYLGGVAEG